MNELFKPQELYSKKALRTVYDRLAHASIMRLNQASMDKVSSCLRPQGCVSYGLPQTGVPGDDVRSGAWPWAAFLVDYHRLESQEMTCAVVHGKRQARVTMAYS